MPNFIPDVEQQAGEIISRAKVLRAVDFEAIARADLGPLSFRDGIPVLKRSFDILLRAASVDLGAVPAEFLRELNSRLNVALQRTDAIRAFNSGTQGPRDRDSLINSWAGDYRADYDAAARCLAAAPIKIPDFSIQEKQIANRLSALETIEKKFDDLKANAGLEIATVLRAAREAAAGTGIAQHAQHFEDEAKRHNWAAIGWLTASLAMAATTALFGYWIADHYANAAGDLSPGRSIQLGIARLFIFSILYTATVWYGRNYKAHKHNQVVNRHRQHALRTFEAFNAAAGADAATKNAVLLQTTAAIFSAAATGFSNEDSETTSQPKIIELIKSVSSTKSE